MWYLDENRDFVTNYQPQLDGDRLTIKTVATKTLNGTVLSWGVA
jgi:hypothetical protein